jgi:hypothetical protein
MSHDPLEGVRPEDPFGQPGRASTFAQPARPSGFGKTDSSSRTKVKLLVSVATCAVLFGAGVALYMAPGAVPKAAMTPKAPDVPQVTPTPTPTAKPFDGVVVRQGPSLPIDPPPAPKSKK